MTSIPSFVVVNQHEGSAQLKKIHSYSSLTRAIVPLVGTTITTQFSCKTGIFQPLSVYQQVIINLELQLEPSRAELSIYKQVSPLSKQILLPMKSKTCLLNMGDVFRCSQLGVL